MLFDGIVYVCGGNVSKTSAIRKIHVSKTLRTKANRAPGIVLRRQCNKNGDHLFLDMHDGAVRKREFLKLYITGDKERDREAMLLAEKIRSKRVQEMQARKSGIEMPVFDLGRDFMAFYKKMSETKGKPWKNTLSHLQKFQPTPLRFADVSEDWINAFRDYLEKNGLATNSIGTYFATLKTSLNAAVRKRLIPQNPFVFVDPIQSKRIQRVYLTLAELQRLVATDCRVPEVKRAFLTACLTGLRISDVRALTWKQVEKDGLHVIQKKTKDYTHIPLSAEVLSLLGKRPPEKSALVFTLPKTDDLFNRNLKRWASDAGIEKHLTSHTARHTFATMLITQGNDLYAVQHLLGHRDIRVTQIYAKLVESRKSTAIMSLPSIMAASSK